MVIPQRAHKEKTFYVEFAKWSVFVNAIDPEEAATLAFEEVLDKWHSNTEVSPIFTVVDIASSVRQMEISDNVTFVYAPVVLSNAGMHETSKKLQAIIENLRSTIKE